MTDLTPTERAAIEADHVQSVRSGSAARPTGYCGWCRMPWPCDAARLLAALAAAEARAERLTEARRADIPQIPPDADWERPQRIAREEGWCKCARPEPHHPSDHRPVHDGGQQP